MKVTFKPLKREVDVTRGTSLLKAAWNAGIRLETDCGGKGRCGKCKVVVHKGVTPLTPKEREYLTTFEIKHKVRLACQAHIKGQTSVSLLTIPFGKERILEEGISHFVSLQPSINKCYLDLTADDLKKERTIREIIEDSLLQQGIKKPKIGFFCLKSLPTLLNKNQGGLTALVKDNEILGFEPGNTTSWIYGLAVDIGTTTVVGYLFDLSQGNLVGVESALNKQAVHGSDVVSRIDHALNAPDGLIQLQEQVVSTINDIVENLCSVSGISSNSVYSLVVVGNTTMNHLFWGISPWFLSRFPYNPLTREMLCVPPEDLGVKMNALGRVFSLPIVSGFIGSDTVGVILSTGLQKSRVPRMAVDIGTNGEIVLTDGKAMVGCSCAAGPAFEGAQIQYGMRATSGAMDRVDFAEGKISYHVIDEVPPKGICGSGLVDALAGMLRAGLIAGDGRLLSRKEIPNSPYARLITRGKYTQFVLNGQDSPANWSEVVITQKDIRELQLAKGAMMAGIRVLMDRLDLKSQDIREVYLAGAFGNYIRAESAVAIGLLPVFQNARITQVGNAAGSGAKMALLSARALKNSVKIAEQIEYVELAKIPNFQQEFVKGMVFPT